MAFTGFCDGPDEHDENGEIVSSLYVEDEWVASWKKFDWRSAPPQLLEALKSVAAHALIIQQKRTARALQQIFGLKG